MTFTTKKIYFLSFADTRMVRSLKRISNQAQEMAIFDHIISATENDLEEAFRKKYRSRLKYGSRGFGYWCWKPQIILQTLENMNDGDILLYLDAGCHFNINGKERLLDYIEYVEHAKSGILGFKEAVTSASNSRNLLKKWTKMDLFKYFNVSNNDNILNASTTQAGTIFIKKTGSAIDIIKQWKQVYEDDFQLLDDTPSKLPNHPDFIDHRHDQAIWSILSELHNFETMSASETYSHNLTFEKSIPDELANYPILVKRDKKFRRTSQDILAKFFKSCAKRLRSLRIIK